MTFPEAFADEVQKLGAPRWVKQFRAGKLSSKAAKRIAAMTGKERELKYLGTGSENIARLMAHPEHGVNVLKTQRLQFSGKAQPFWEHVKKEQAKGRLSSIGKVLETDPKARMLRMKYYEATPYEKKRIRIQEKLLKRLEGRSKAGEWEREHFARVRVNELERMPSMKPGPSREVVPSPTHYVRTTGPSSGRDRHFLPRRCFLH